MKYNFTKKAFFLLIFVVTGHYLTAQNYWQQRVEYVINIDFDVKKHQFEGSQTLKYFNNSPDTLRKVFYHLYFNAFQPQSMMDVRSKTIRDPDARIKDRIDKLDNSEIGYHIINKIEQDGIELNYQIESTILEVDLAKPLLPGTTTTFAMEFESQVPVQIRRSGRNNKEGIDYSMAQWFPKMAEYDRRGWHAHPYVAREFYAPWGDYEVNITIDSDYIIGGTGVLQNAEEIGYGYQAADTDVKRTADKVTWKFKAEEVHDFVWSADRDYSHVTAQVPNGPLLHFLYQDTEDTKLWKDLPQYTIRAMEFIQELCGKYPYPQWSVIQAGDGGMEYPMATLITGHRSLQSLVGVVVHELMHSWYQGLLATNESYYGWMDEGYTEYVSALVMAHLFEKKINWKTNELYTGYIALAYSGYEEPMTTHADHFATNFAYSRAAYSKGAVSLAQLGYVIGEEKRNATLLRYFEEWKFKHPDHIDFIRVAEKISGLELDWYYDYWVNTTEYIDYGIAEPMESDGKTIVTLERTGRMPMPIDLYVTLDNGEKRVYYIPLGIMRGEKENETELERTTLSDWYWTHPIYTFELDIPLSKIKQMEIDETGLMADIDRRDNIWKN